MLDIGLSTGATETRAARAVRVGPLAGVRVLDFTHVLAGPFCTRVLADLGADIVRIESSQHPDSPWKTSADRGLERPAAYLITNRGKRSVAINLKTDPGRDLAIRMAGVADVVIENFSAGVMDRLGLGDAHLRPLNPRLVYVSMSGYGHDGPRRGWTSMNMNLQGYSGLLTITGGPDDPPTAISNSWNDYVGGLHAAVGVVVALSGRATTGLGRNLDLSQFECSVGTLGALLLSSAVNGVAPPRMGNRSAHAAPQGCYRCSGEDEWCAISVQTDQQWDALVAAMGAPSWAAGGGFATAVNRLRRHDEIDRHLEEWARARSAGDVQRLLQVRGVPAQPMRRAQTLREEPDGATVFRPMSDPRKASILVTALPFLRDLGVVIADTPAPGLGADTSDVLRDWLQLGDDEVEQIARQEALV